jgi:hypothetical protein
VHASCAVTAPPPSRRFAPPHVARSGDMALCRSYVHLEQLDEPINADFCAAASSRGLVLARRGGARGARRPFGRISGCPRRRSLVVPAQDP